MSNVRKIHGSYKELTEALVKEPETEEDLVKLNAYIAGHEDKLKEFGQEVSLTSEYINLLFRYEYQYNEEAMMDFWVLRVCPLETKIAVSEGRKIAGNQEQSFMTRLENDKKEFDMQLATLKTDFEYLKGLSDYKIFDHAIFAVEIGNKLESAAQKVQGFNQRETLFNLPLAVYEDLDTLSSQFGPYKKMWDTKYQFQQDKDQWQTGPLVRVKFPDVMKKVDQ
jgi:hypothetical protein